jgi:hypothetical protein
MAIFERIKNQAVSKNKVHITLIRFVIYHLDSMHLRLLMDEQTILRKNTLLLLSSNIETTHDHKGLNFILCPSCFWCASCLSPESTFTKCPYCNEGNIESLPIAENENYTFSYDIKRGIAIEFRQA